MMVKIIQRVKGSLCKVNDEDSKQINLENLVHAGNELIWFNVSQNPDEEINRKILDKKYGVADEIANQTAEVLALSLAQAQSVDYVLLSRNHLQFNKSLRDVPNYVYIATFYNERRNNLN